MPYLATESGVTIHYDDQGEGRPLVFIHGWGMSSRVWRFQAERFAPSYRVITIDLRGHGESGLPEGEGLSMADLAADVAALFRELDLERAVLVGWSLGALVCLKSYGSVRDRLAALVLVGGTPRFTAGDGYESGLQPADVRGMALRVRRDRAKTMGEFFRGMFTDRELSREQNRRLVTEIVIPSRQPDTPILLKSLEILASSDQREVLPLIDLPVMLIHGSDDTICLPAASRYMAERIPGSELAIIDGCGHAPFMSMPDRFNAAFDGFLERVYAGN